MSKLNLLEQDNFRSYLTGCIRTEQLESGLRLHRHTKKQIDYYAGANDAWSIRSLCPAGMRLNLVTDSKTLELTGRVLPGARTYAGFDIEVDGRDVASIRMETSDQTQIISFAEFETASPRTISVTFPQSAVVEVDAITLDAKASTSPLDPPERKYLAIGDSITHGMNAFGPSSAYAVQLSRILNAELLNLGVGGHIYDLGALDDDLPFKPDVVTIAYGTNDWTRETTQDQIAETVDAYLTRLLATVAKSADVYVLTPIWRAIGHEAKTGGTLTEFSTTIAEAASKFSVTVVDGTKLVPHLPALLPDGTHPNDEGFLHYAINLHRAMAE